MSDHPHAVLMRRALQAFQTGDMPVLEELFHPDVRWHVPGRSPVSGVHAGRAAFFAFLGRLMEISGGTFKVDNRAVLADDEGGVFVDQVSAQRDGRALDLSLLLRVLIRDGRIVEGFDHFYDTAAWDAFWA
jgi:hypothetical protein